jgi:hypothetical protein
MTDVIRLNPASLPQAMGYCQVTVAHPLGRRSVSRSALPGRDRGDRSPVVTWQPAPVI